MKDKKLVITINKPIGEVFDFAINPKNTPKWIDFIEAEETNEWPVKLGTTYRNHGKDSDWSEYVMSDFKPNETFTLSRKDGAYQVKYSFKKITDNQTELEYYEWTNSGNLEDPFKQETLDKLKDIIESN